MVYFIVLFIAKGWDGVLFAVDSILRYVLTNEGSGKIWYEFNRLFKGQCHEDFAVLGRFWTKIITSGLHSSTKCFCKAATKISNEFYQRRLIIINFL